MSTAFVKGENILVKEEFLVRKEVKAEVVDTDVGGATESGEGGDGAILTKRKPDSRDEREDNHKKVALKNRHQHAHPEKEDRLCGNVVKGVKCMFTDCKYSHDILAYLANKEPDLGPVCHQFETFGFCSNGVMCRFGSSHIDAATGASLTRSEERGGVIERKVINVLGKEAQSMLRKKKYTKGEDYYVVPNRNNKNQKKNSNQDQRAPQAAAPAPAPVAEAAAVLEGTGSSAEALDAANTNKTESIKVEVDAALVAPSIVASTDPATSPPVPAVPPTSSTAPTNAARADYNLSSYPERCVKLVDFSNKVYIAPLTTVGNLPFRRILKEYGADITCGEMAMANNIVAGQASEWALMKRHAAEDCFGVQVAGGYADTMSLTARILENEVQSDFVDLNSACPIDLVCNRGCGSALMTKSNRLFEILDAMSAQLPSRSVTIKIRTGWNEKAPIAHELIPQIQTRFNNKLSAIMLHGRSRLQRYSKLANWDYILQAAQSQNPSLRRIPVIGNGDILSWEDWRDHQHLLEENLHLVAQRSAKVTGFDGAQMQGADASEVEGDKEVLGLTNCAMLARGALIKPWLPQEIKEQRVIDISATERLDILRKYCNYGLEHWGSDQQGVNNTRRFLLEWMSFLHRYVPAGILEQPYAQGMNQRPPHYLGRGDLETLLSSPSSADWIKVSEMFLGPVAKDYTFIPKHKSNSYANPAENLPEG